MQTCIFFPKIPSQFAGQWDTIEVGDRAAIGITSRYSHCPVNRIFFQITTTSVKADDGRYYIVRNIEKNKEEVDNLMRKSFDFYQSFCSLEKIKKTYSEIFEEVLYFKSMWK